MTDYQPLIDLGFLIASVLFIVGLKLMAHPRTAVRGNLFGAAGMALAMILALIGGSIAGYVYVALGLAIGSAVGVYLATTTPMTKMPELVALFNGLGGLASVVVAFAALLDPAEAAGWDGKLATGLSGLIGAVTATGSAVAYLKLAEHPAFKKAFSVPGQQAIAGSLLAIALAASVGMIFAVGGSGTAVLLYILIVLAAGVLGVMLTTPIGGADMPVVIALLNSYSGLAAAATGFVIDNNVLIISGSLVGASGIILTNLMCKAMNRSLFNVLFGVMGGGADVADADEVYKTVRSTSADDVSMILDGASRVVIVPGYGMAVAQAQHAVRDLADYLEARGTNVEYAIHPVAGRMPGHMNVLLAEANISYDKLKEMDDINPTMNTVDVAIVIGANDVVNPVAREPGSAIAGMPILDVDKARTVVVIKRSLSPGFAGIPNPLFAAENTLMLYADAQAAAADILKALKENA